ncbi:MAG: pyruvoyl-dependent arginine decarboxylase [Candidatus Nezhaarchaeales archaeon]
MNTNCPHGIFLPKYFFVTSGKAVSSESPLNAFDLALMDAKIDQCNIVSVSSIIPPDAKQIDPINITPGTIVFAVLARMDGASGETIGAGIAWAWGTRNGVDKYGVVAEAHGYKDKQALEKELKAKIQMMGKIRRLSFTDIYTKVESIDTIPKGKYGCVVSAFVYVPWSEKEGGRNVNPTSIKQ